MNITSNIESVNLVKKISESVKTFHHHYHILFDIAKFYDDALINYVEIGTFCGGSACLMMHRPNTNIVSIDIGLPVSKDEAISNVNKFNSNSNYYYYIEGDSKNEITLLKLKDILNTFNNNDIDILFIDGDHSYKGVYDDFINYHELVKVGGFLVFDDYMDNKYSPEVKPAVDDIVDVYCNQLGIYEPIGCLENEHGAYPHSLTTNNCFIIRKVL